ncbi:MAG: glutathione transferase [Myxococcales bacterium]|nr:glutathione transferase [Myxococcales bacterium]
MTGGQLTLFVDGYFANPFDATCFITLTEKQLPFSFARALLRDGQGLPPGLATRTAISRVPALQHGDFVLTESLAIADYLEDTFPTPHVFPVDPRGRARARQIMAWIRFDLRDLRWERPWWTTIYPATLAPLTPTARKEAQELVDVTGRLLAQGDLDTWSIAHADLALTVSRIRDDDVPIPDRVRAFRDHVYARPSVRAYTEHPRPPNPPP